MKISIQINFNFNYETDQNTRQLKKFEKHDF